MSSRRVYSTESGRLCPGCSQPADACRCKSGSLPQVSGPVRLRRETKGRKGAGVTLVDNISSDPAELKRIAKALKQRCSSGGAIKHDVIEIQGDHRETIEQWLQKAGYKSVRAGG